MKYVITTLKLTLALSMLMNSAGQGYALRPMAESNSRVLVQGLLDNVRQNIWAVMRYKEDPWPAEKLKKYIANADRKLRLPKPFADFTRPFLDYLELLKKGLESIDNEHPGLQANFLLYVSRKIREKERESKYMRYPHGEAIRQLYKNLIKTVFPGSLLAKIREFKEIGAERKSSERLKELNTLLRKLYGVSFSEVIAYMHSMGDSLTEELFEWVPEQCSFDLRYKIDDFRKKDYSLGKTGYKARLTELIKRGLHITEGDRIFGMGDTRWSLLLHYFAVKAAEKKFAEKEAIKAFDGPGNIKAVFLDVAGVILFEHIRRVAGNLANYCDKSEKEILEIMGPRKFWEDLDRGEIIAEEYFKRIKARLNLSPRLNYRTFLKFWTDVYEVNPEAEDTIRQLKKAGYKIYIISNCCKAHRERYCERFDYIFDMVDGFVASYEEGVMKPDEEIFRKGLELAGLNSWEVVFVDDAEDNVRVAASLGIASLQYLSGKTALQSGLADLIGYLNRLLKEILTEQQSTLKAYRVIAAVSKAA